MNSLSSWPARAQALCRASTSCSFASLKDVDGIRTRACPSSASVTAASRVNPTCSDIGGRKHAVLWTAMPGHDREILSRLCAQLLVLRLGALRGRTHRNARGIVDKFLTLGNDLEDHAPADIGADHDIGGGELIAHEPRPLLDRLGQHIHRGVEVAITEHLAVGRVLARRGAVDDRGLKTTRPEEQPFEISAALRRADRHVELLVGKFVGRYVQIAASSVITVSPCLSAGTL